MSTLTICSAVLTVALCSLLTGSSAALTLVERSSGLPAVDMEEGHTEFEVGDVDADGHLDLVSVGDHGSPLVNSTEHGIMTFLGDGAGTWTVHQVGNFGYGGVALGDLDRDGFLDAAWGIHHNWSGGALGDQLIEAALGDGTGTAWASWDAGLASNGEDWGMFATDLGDFDEDGRLDLVSQSFGGSNGVRLYRNLGDGTWSQTWSIGGSVAYTIESGDFDGDGHLDIVCTSSTGTAWFGDGAFGFVRRDAGIMGGARSVAVGDLDDDGRDDIAVAYGTGGARVYSWDGGATSWNDRSSGLAGAANFVQLGDLDGDGDDDLVTYAAPTGRTWIGDGTGNWVADANWTMPSPGDGAALRIDGDVDHDGRDDIVVVAVRSGFPFYRNQLRVYSPWQAPPGLSLRILSPGGGESYVLGAVRDIRWRTAVPDGVGPVRIRLELSLDGSAGPWEEIAADLPDNGRYEWRVDALHASGTARIRVTATSPAAALDEVSAVSSGDFAILGGAVSAVAEVGGVPDPFSFRVHPNPVRFTNDGLVLSVDASLGERFRLYDPSGRLLALGRARNGRLRLALVRGAEGAAPSSGVYFLEATDSGRRSRVLILQ